MARESNTKNRSQDKQAEAADQLARAIAAFTDELIDEEMSQYVERLYQHGGWELGFWEGSESGISPTRDDIIELLNHWPARADDQPKLPSAADFPEFEVLRDIVDREFLFSIGETPLISATEYFALLALIKLGQAAGELRSIWGETDAGIIVYHCRGPWKPSSLVDAGNLLLEAMESVCYAERQLSNEQLDDARARKACTS